MSSCPFFCNPLEDKIYYVLFGVEGLFVLRPVSDLDFVSVFNLWVQHRKTYLYS
jgi:hypothetical protein